MGPAQMVTFRLANNLASWIVTIWAAFFLLRHTPLTLPHCRVLSARPRNFPQRRCFRHTGALWGFRPEPFRFPQGTVYSGQSSQVFDLGCFSLPCGKSCSCSNGHPGRSSAPVPCTLSHSCCSQSASASYELLHLQPYSSAQLPVSLLGCTESDSGLANLMLPTCCGR